MPIPEMSEEEYKEWFPKNFFDTRKHGPQKGQVLARYRSAAFFVDAWVKRNVIDILMQNKETGAEMAVKILHNMCSVVKEDAIALALDITEDLLAGKSIEEVAKHEYKMTIEFFFWTKAEYIPDDIHWSKIDLLNSDDELDSHFKVTYSEKIAEPALV